VTILIMNNFLFCKLLSKLFTILINHFLLPKFIVDERFSYNDKYIKYMKI